jgi:hypothetical protein
MSAQEHIKAEATREEQGTITVSHMLLYSTFQVIHCLTAATYLY